MIDQEKDQEKPEILATMQHRTVFGGYQIPVCVKHALCSDGKRRYAQITTAHANDAWSIDACVKVKGKTVMGFVSAYRHDDGKDDYTFTAYQQKKNGYLLP